VNARDILLDLSLFSELEETELVQIEPLCRLVEFKTGDYLIREGEAVQDLFILLSGEAAVLKNKAGASEVDFATVAKGDLLGEITFFKMTFASASVKATSAVKAVAFNQRDLHSLLSARPTFGCKVYKKIARVLSERTRKLIDLVVR
jgi:CRP-like cAMP-binding protein